ncbi:MAG: hypothetical protein AB7P34_05445 [Vicinamibacterales bacterium]
MTRLTWALLIAAAPAWSLAAQPATGGAASTTTTIPAVTFTEHVAPIVFANCTSCHRPGEAAPFPLMTYDDVAKRGRLIAAVTRSRLMPPWKAAPGSHRFRDERRLADAEIDLIQRWVDQGVPRGPAAKMPSPPTFAAGWALGPPDLIVEMAAAYQVPADGPDIYRNFVLPLAIPGDKWVRAIDLRPSARTAVHHVLYFADASGEARKSDAGDPLPGFAGMRPGGLRSTPLGGWALGQQPHLYPDGIALPLPANADLVLQFHFHPTGKAEAEKTAVGLYFADRAPERTLTAIQLPPLFSFFAGLDIPAGEPRFQIEDSFELPVDVEGIAIGAHAHYLGKQLTMTATLPDGTEQTLLAIPDWDFAWQDRYMFKTPAVLPKGTRLRARITWDNSAGNPRNPSNPPARVTWGEQSTDEMGSVTLQVIPRRQEDSAALQAAYRRHVLRSMITRGR